MIKKIIFAFTLISLLTTAASAKLSPAIDIIEKKLENRPCVTGTNFAPVAHDLNFETQCGISLIKSFDASDPEGSELSFEIIKFPSHGSVEFTHDGQFIYTPVSDYTGKDYFSYRAVDAYSSASAEKKVQIKVSRPAADIFFDDMKNHWAHNAAIKMASTTLMPGTVTDDGFVFEPEKDMTRGDFLALTLIMSGHETQIPYASKTVFADDTVIPQNIKSYVQYAFDKGIISGYDNPDESINFEAQSSITRAEAATIVSKILSLSDISTSDLSLYRDSEKIPAWASQAIAALSEIGIFSGNADGDFSADRKLTRAEGAEIICNVADYVQDKKQEENKKNKGFFSFFSFGKGEK